MFLSTINAMCLVGTVFERVISLFATLAADPLFHTAPLAVIEFLALRTSPR